MRKDAGNYSSVSELISMNINNGTVVNRINSKKNIAMASMSMQFERWGDNFIQMSPLSIPGVKTPMISLHLFQEDGTPVIINGHIYTIIPNFENLYSTHGLFVKDNTLYLVYRNNDKIGNHRDSKLKMMTFSLRSI